MGEAHRELIFSIHTPKLIVFASIKLKNEGVKIINLDLTFIFFTPSFLNSLIKKLCLTTYECLSP